MMKTCSITKNLLDDLFFFFSPFTTIISIHFYNFNFIIHREAMDENSGLCVCI